MSNLTNRIQQIEEKIQAACERSGRNRDEVHIVAVTKSVSNERTAEVLAAGFEHLGENRPDGFMEKVEHNPEGARWHFIGNLQSRRIRDIIHDVSFIHSLSRKSIAKEIQKRSDETIDCFVQVNVSGEESKSGLEPEEVRAFIESIESYDKVRIIGLMTMAPNIEDQEEIRGYFKRLRAIRDEIQAAQLSNAPCTELSMGMSNDYELAIEEGATYIRIGTALVGEESEGDS